MGIRKLTTGHAAVLLAALIGLSSADAAARPARAATATAVVRVNQVGYPTTATKRAYLMSSVDETGATFAVKSGATTVVLGSDRRPARFVELAPSRTSTRSTSPAATAGTYTIAVTGPVAATSPRFRIDTGQHRLRRGARELARLLPGSSATEPASSPPRFARPPAI